MHIITPAEVLFQPIGNSFIASVLSCDHAREVAIGLFPSFKASKRNYFSLIQAATMLTSSPSLNTTIEASNGDVSKDVARWIVVNFEKITKEQLKDLLSFLNECDLFGLLCLPTSLPLALYEAHYADSTVEASVAFCRSLATHPLSSVPLQKYLAVHPDLEVRVNLAANVMTVDASVQKALLASPDTEVLAGSANNVRAFLGRNSSACFDTILELALSTKFEDVITVLCSHKFSEYSNKLPASFLELLNSNSIFTLFGDLKAFNHVVSRASSWGGSTTSLLLDAFSVSSLSKDVCLELQLSLSSDAVISQKVALWLVKHANSLPVEAVSSLLALMSSFDTQQLLRVFHTQESIFRAICSNKSAS